MYGLWFLFKTCVSITVLVVALSRQETAKENFYDSHRICDMCYLQSLQNPTVLYEFDRCGNIYQNYTTYYWNGTQGILHLKYSDNPNLLWTPRSGDVKSSSGVLIVAIVDWLIIMYFALTSVIQIKRAITLGNKHDLEQAKSYLIHNALLCHMIVFSIANTLWDLDPGDQGCYIAFLPVSYARADILIALVYILVFIVSSCCMAKSKLFTRVHILSLMSYALYSLVASVVSSKLSGNWHYPAFVFIVFFCIFDIPCFFHQQSAVRQYMGYGELLNPQDNEGEEMAPPQANSAGNNTTRHEDQADNV